jgi:hypothetical protein
MVIRRRFVDKAIPTNVEEVVQKLTLPEGLKDILDVTKLPDITQDIPGEFTAAVQDFSGKFQNVITQRLSKITKENFIKEFTAVIDDVKAGFEEFRGIMEQASAGDIKVTELGSKLEEVCRTLSTRSSS